MGQEDAERRTREGIKELEEARLRISGDVMEGKPGALEEDERLRERILELLRRLTRPEREDAHTDVPLEPESST